MITVNLIIVGACFIAFAFWMDHITRKKNRSKKK